MPHTFAGHGGPLFNFEAARRDEEIRVCIFEKHGNTDTDVHSILLSRACKGLQGELCNFIGYSR